MEIPQDEKDEKEIILKKKYTGHMRFIGEIYMQELMKVYIHINVSVYVYVCIFIYIYVYMILAYIYHLSVNPYPLILTP
jgi:hypothetical protein